MPRRDYDDDQRVVIIEKESGGLGSFFAGLAIGAGLALLFAPQSGKEMRRGMRRRARRARHAARRAVDDMGEAVTETFTEARRQVEDRLDAAREALDFRKDQVTRAMDAGRAAAQEAREELERRLAKSKGAYEPRGPRRRPRAGGGSGPSRG